MYVLERQRQAGLVRHAELERLARARGSTDNGPRAAGAARAASRPPLRAAARLAGIVNRRFAAAVR